MEGEVLGGRYELRGVLGRGGMAEVRDGWDTRLNRAAAIRLLHPTLTAQPDMRRRFEDEARSVAALGHHPNIVAVYDYGDHNSTPFIVMERLRGLTLGDEIARGPLPPNRVHAMLIDVLVALATAHTAGILHRDIKPGNILLSTTGHTMKVADFGIAKTAGVAHTMTGQIVGTLAYMSPERISGAPASVADDLYAVGVMAYEALTGRRAFPQENVGVLARAVMDNPPPPITLVRPDIEPSLAAVIDRAMARDPHQRFPTAEQMLAALAEDTMAMRASAAPAGACPRPATKVLVEPLPPSATHFVPAPPPRVPASRTRKILWRVPFRRRDSVALLRISRADNRGVGPGPRPVVVAGAPADQHQHTHAHTHNIDHLHLYRRRPRARSSSNPRTTAVATAKAVTGTREGTETGRATSGSNPQFAPFCPPLAVEDVGPRGAATDRKNGERLRRLPDHIGPSAMGTL